MAVKDSAAEAAKIAIQSIGRGYDISFDLRLKFCAGESAKPLLVQIGEEQSREVVLPGGIRIPNVSKWIKCDKGERTRFRSDVLSFQQMSEHFNQQLSLTGKIPSGLFNTMFQFSGCWQQDAANTKTLAFDGVFITLYTVALEKSQMNLCDHVKDAVPSTWDPAALAKFIQNFGTHVIVGMKMGGRDVIYVKQQHSSSLQPADVQKRLKILADKRFVGTDGQDSVELEQIFLNGKTEVRDQRLRFAESSSSSSYSQKEMDIVSICKRRGGNDNGNPKHSAWLHSVQSEPEVISMSFIPITSLLNGVPGSGFLSHAINQYLRYKPPIEELNQFLEFQLPRQWAPVFSDLPLGPQRKQQTTTSLQFSFMGPKLYVNTMPVEVGARPVTGLRLYLEGRRSNRLAIHLQHLSSLPKVFKLETDPSGNFHHESYDHRYYEKVQWKNFSHVCTAPVEPENDLSIVTAAKFQVSDYGMKKILFLRLRYSTVSGVASVKEPQWDHSPGLARKSGLISTLISQRFTSTFTKPPPQPAEVNINSAVYPGGPPTPNQAPKLLRFVDTTEMMRGPQDSPGYWVVSGARLMVEKGRISIRVRYSLLTFIPEDDDDDEDFGNVRNKKEF